MTDCRRRRCIAATAMRQRFQSSGLNFSVIPTPPTVIPAPAGIYALQWNPIFAAATAPHPNHLKRNAARIQPRLDTTPDAVDNAAMIEIVPSDACQRWLARLRDRNALARIQARLLRIAADGHFGDVAPTGDGVSEIRIH